MIEDASDPTAAAAPALMAAEVAAAKPKPAAGVTALVAIVFMCVH
jgi:hypothetical protein